ncbi:MAG: hypothetical protein WA414_14840 [Acidobacteriaceae bacterium]
MNFVAVAALLSGLIAAGWQSSLLQPDQNANTERLNTEQIERGEIQVPGAPAGEVVRYRIRLLPVASFPGLPAAVGGQLRSRQCMIPQSFEAQAPENVIHGAFRAPGSDDWAALCSVGGSTTLYVFLSGQFDAPIALRSQPDTAWLGAEPGASIFGSGWGIAVRSASTLRATRQMHGTAVFDHDGIEDARLERSATVRYWQDGKWLDLGGLN